MKRRNKKKAPGCRKRKKIVSSRYESLEACKRKSKEIS
jgi:hypothetical protein